MSALELIANVETSGTASVGWTSIPQTYKHLYFKGLLVAPSSGSYTAINILLNQTASTGSNYISNAIGMTQSAATAMEYGNTPAFAWSKNYPATNGSAGTGSNSGTVIEGWVSYYTLANNDWGDVILAFKASAKGGNGSGNTFLRWSMVELEVVAALNAIQFERVDGTYWQTGSTISLYGLGS
tara:strand:- start:477 stop:1025 length:549 start_codon:yes stop_codon:yes gene_type:complete